MSQTPFSWASMAEENASVEVTKASAVSVPVAQDTKTVNEDVGDLNPLLADVMEKEPKKKKKTEKTEKAGKTEIVGEIVEEEGEDEIDIEEEWRRDPFEAFKQGVAVVFLLWDALQLIIENALVDEADAMSDLLEYDLIQVFIETKGKIIPEDLSIWLNETMEQNFYTAIEDGSTGTTAKILVELYENCMKKKNFDQLNGLMQRAFEQMESGEERKTTCFVEELDGLQEHDHHGDDDDDDYYDEDYDEDDEDYDGEDDCSGDGCEHDHEHDNKVDKHAKQNNNDGNVIAPELISLGNEIEGQVEGPEPKKVDRDRNDDDGWTSVPFKGNGRQMKPKTDKKKK